MLLIHAEIKVNPYQLKGPIYLGQAKSNIQNRGDISFMIFKKFSMLKS